MTDIFEFRKIDDSVFKEDNPRFSKEDVLRRYDTVVSRESVAFESEEDFERRFRSGVPIYVDASYYVHEKSVTLVTEDNWRKWARWRDCHYYDMLADRDGGSMIYMMTGGRYD